MANFEPNAYRQGLTLGLTMAEIFLLILFLLLLAFLVLSKEHSQTKEALAVAERESLIDLPEKIERLTRENNELKSAKKGVDPPCWYKVVYVNGERHERTYYLLDVAVHDRYLSVRLNRALPLPGRAVDENNQQASTSYAEEFKKLPLAGLRARKEKKISLTVFRKIAKPIKDMGQDMQIRNYACVFYAKIWDRTRPTSKKRWKTASHKIEEFFYPLLVQNDPWE